MAVNLKLKKKCHIVAPDWLSVDYLQARLTDETTQRAFSELPFRYSEISKVLLDVASDDLENPDKLRSLLKDFREARQAKTRAGLVKINSNELSLVNFCAMEVNEIRPYFIESMSLLKTFQPQKQDFGNMMDE
ncbi:hypothetical protein AX16_000945 [Volvariella volvacea WC 439]|nr:hypothetical protein AX16_000945 [Volvariella volvacea WC 439]